MDYIVESFTEEDLASMSDAQVRQALENELGEVQCLLGERGVRPMELVRFYLEYPSAKEKNRRPAASRKHTGNVIAAYLEPGGKDGRNLGEHSYFLGVFRDGELMIEGASALFDHPNSVVCSGSVAWTYLRERCVRISEKEAREIHPNLFLYLDM